MCKGLSRSGKCVEGLCVKCMCVCFFCLSVCARALFVVCLWVFLSIHLLLIYNCNINLLII